MQQESEALRDIDQMKPQVTWSEPGALRDTTRAWNLRRHSQELSEKQAQEPSEKQGQEPSETQNQEPSEAMSALGRLRHTSGARSPWRKATSVPGNTFRTRNLSMTQLESAGS